MGDGIPTDLTRQEKISLLHDLKRAYYMGVTRVRFRERDVSYRSKADMKSIIDQLENELKGQKRKHVIMTTFGRGY